MYICHNGHTVSFYTYRMTDGSLCLTGPHSIVSIQLPSLFIYSTELEGFSSKRSVRTLYMYVATLVNFAHQLEIHLCLVINSRESKAWVVSNVDLVYCCYVD